MCMFCRLPSHHIANVYHHIVIVYCHIAIVYRHITIVYRHIAIGAEISSHSVTSRVTILKLTLTHPLECVFVFQT